MTIHEPPRRDALASAAIHEHWVATYRTPETERFYELAFDEIARSLNAPPDSTILDAGCGSCAKSVLLARRGFTVVGADFSLDALTLAADKIRSMGLDERITLRHGNILDLPFENGEFKYAICWGVLMHVPDLQRALDNLARVLAPGGILVLSEGNVRSVQASAMRALKAILGKGRGRILRTPAGIESHEQTDQGILVTRQTDMRWLAADCARRGLVLEARIAGQFTELYALAPWQWLRRLIHAFNNAWFRFVGWPGPAFGNILIFRKTAGGGA